MSKAYLGLGGNVGDRLAYLREAVRRLGSHSEIRVLKTSSVFETAPVGVVDQPPFLNAVAQVETALEPRGLLQHCLQVETELGRVRRERWGPRTIDIDVLWFGSRVCAEVDFVLPHPRMRERAFVLVPLAEIAPDLMLDDKRVEAWASALDQTGLRRVGNAEVLKP